MGDELGYGKTKVFITMNARRKVFVLGNLRASNMILYSYKFNIKKRFSFKILTVLVITLG